MRLLVTQRSKGRAHGLHAQVRELDDLSRIDLDYVESDGSKEMGLLEVDPNTRYVDAKATQVFDERYVRKVDRLKLAIHGVNNIEYLERIINFDGNKLGMCANGVLCLARYIVEGEKLAAHIYSIKAVLWMQQVRTLDAIKIKAIDSFELAYNIACSLSEEDKLKDAEQLLLTGRNIDQETPTKESLVDNVIENELHPFVIQLTYVHQLLGQTHEGTGAYTYIINQNLTVEPSQCKEKHSQKFDLAYEFNLKLSPKQETMYAIRVLLLLHANKMDPTRKFVSVLLEMFPDNVMPILFQATALVIENRARKTEEILGQFTETLTENVAKLHFVEA
ncbi:hypothetical protein V6N11_034407 [Hibiscus sabdariffa]|uniref:Uncharacterized protein n=2 Tax=Hibiscus sabdariffa TaxID=183260 RepID=A0ABR1Z8L9_9ROSI